MNSKIVILVVLAISAVNAQVSFPGRCPEQQVVQNFDVAAYLGRWYEVEKYFAAFEAGGQCIEANYSDKGNGTVGVLNIQIQSATGEERRIEGTARLTSDDGSAKLGVVFPTVPDNIEAPYWVLDTDYTNSSLVWACTDIGGLFNVQYVWFLSRERNPSEEVRNRVHDLMDQVGIRRDYLLVTNQTNCE